MIFSCGVQKNMKVQTQEDQYKIIEKVKYVDKSLYYKTLSYDQLPVTHMFSYDKINEAIDYRLKNLESFKLKKSQMSNPEVLSKIRTPYGTPLDEQKGFNSVTFPVIVNSAEGVPFGFIYRDSSGLLHIYKKEENNWEEFARVEIHLL